MTHNKSFLQPLLFYGGRYIHEIKNNNDQLPRYGAAEPGPDNLLQERGGVVVAGELTVTEQGERHRSTASYSS